MWRSLRSVGPLPRRLGRLGGRARAGSSDGGTGFGKDCQSAPDQLVEGLQRVSQSEDAPRERRTAVMGESDFYEIDAQVNEFKAIGIDDGALKEDMRELVDRNVASDVLVSEPFTRPSRNGNYVAVSVGPVRVDDREQVVEICTTMQSDSRVRWVI